MCCAEAGDPISTDSNVAAPKNRVLVILLLLIIDPPTWAVGEQDRHFGDNIPGKDQSADHGSAIPMEASTRTLDQWRRRCTAGPDTKYRKQPHAK
jgi:hypothetical protein